MNNIVLLLLCLIIGILLGISRRLPKDTHVALNGFVIYISLPSLIFLLFRDLDIATDMALAVAMPWLLFSIGCLFFWTIGKLLKFDRPTTGSLMLVGGLANTSFVGLPMIEAFYGPDHMPIGILIDQLGTYLVLSTLGISVAAFYAGGSVSGGEIIRRVATFPPLVALMLSALLFDVTFPAWFDEVLYRLSVTLVPLALVSVGLQLRIDAFNGNLRALLVGLSFKLILGPAIITLIYVGVLNAGGQIVRVTLFESAMGPMIGAAVVASQNGLNPPLVSLMVGCGILLSFLTLPLWHSVFEMI